MDENERQAATMKVSISNYVGTAALAVVGGAAALYAYVSQTYDAPASFHALMLVAVGALVFSIVLGGSGSDAVANRVARGEWTRDIHVTSFRWQAILTLAGLVLVLGATVVGVRSERSESTSSRRLNGLAQELRELRVRLQDEKRVTRELTNRLTQVERSKPRR